MSLLFDPGYTILSEHRSQKLFTGVLIGSQCSGALAVLLVAIWMGAYENGFGWTSEPEKEFHYHPTLMVMGMVFLYGESLLVYRIFRYERKRFSKLLHVALHSAVLLLSIVALKAAFDSHDLHVNKEGVLDPLPNLYSLHSWIGLTVVIAYSVQYIAGFTTFFFPGLSLSFRATFLPFHQLAGLLIFCCVSLTVALGISERAAWKHTCWTVDHEFCGRQAISNLLGLCVFVYSACILLLVGNPRWRRVPLPEEQSLHQLSHTDID